MTLTKKIIGTLLATGMLVSMTMPGSLANELPGAVVDGRVSSLVARVGVVTDIAEADSVTVAISGSNVLVTASYLFPQYLPLLADRVYVVRQDAQWFVLGTMSGPINSLALNPSFEDGVTGGVPSNWTFANSVVAAGVPTFTKQPSNGFSAVSGSYVGFGELVAAAATNISVSDIRSAVVPTMAGSRWTLGVYFSAAVSAVPNAVVFLTSNIEFLNGAGAVLAVFPVNTATIEASFLQPIIMRPDPNVLVGNAAIAPAGTVSARAHIEIMYNMTINSSANVKLDHVEFRRVP